MATGKRYYWLKLYEDFLTGDIVDYLMTKNGVNGASYIILYEMLCIKSINTYGRLEYQVGEVIIPYDVDKIARELKWFSTDTIIVALNIFKSLGLIYEDINGTLVLVGYNKLVGSETDYAVQKKLQRQNQQQQLPPPNKDEGVDIVHSDVHTDIEKDKEKDIDTDIYQKRESDVAVPQAEAAALSEHISSCPFSKIMELYHQICISYPRINSIESHRKKAVKACWRIYGDLNVFENVFRMAEDSLFLKGYNDRNWSADFDWMMQPKNISKILNHKYDDLKEKEKPKPECKGSFDTDEFIEAAVKRSQEVIKRLI